MLKRIVVVLAVLALVATGCAKKSSTTPKASPTAAGPQTVGVMVDGKTEAFNGSFTAYFPNDVSVHPGDTVTFTETFSGEPHTVTFGTLVDAGLKKVTGPDAEEPEELKKIPPLLPDGPGDAIQASAQPCFLPSGDPPASDACTKAQQQQPEFDGKQTYYNSGFLPDQAVFKVKLADSIAPGTYSYFCALHRGAMTGKVTVVAKDAASQAADEVAKAGRDQFAALVQKLVPAATALKTGTAPPVVPAAAPGSVLAGSGDPTIENALVVQFGPQEVSVPAGGAVTWTIIGPHTIAFNASEDLRVFIAKAPDGSVHLNPKSFAPAGGPGAPAPPSGPEPTGPPGPPTVVDAGSWNGTGLHNSGIFLSFPPQLLAYKLKFTKAGSYSYVCLIHPEMKGTVKVG